jgi:putative MATE family efflux protein
MIDAKRNFGTAAFYRTALSIAVPVMLQALLQNLVSLIDNFMVAGLGDVKMGAVNVTNQILFVFFVALNTVISAGGIFMSQYNGARDGEGMRHTFRFKIITGIILGVVVTALSVAIPAQMLGALVNVNTASAAIVAEGKKYLAIIVLTFFPIVISTVIGASLREIGQVKPPLVISLAATLVNTFFNWVLIYGNLGAPRLEVQGAAIATVIARVAEVIAYLAFIRVTKPGFYVRFTEWLKVDLALYGRILRKSGVIFASEMSWVITETVMTAVYNGRGGAEVVSGMAAAWAIANVFMLIFGAVHTSVGVIVGGTLGRGELAKARDEARWLRSGSIIAGFAIAFIEAFSVALVPIVFGNLSPDAQAVTRNMIWVIAFYMPTWTYLNAQFATARSGGDAIMGAWVDVSVNTLMFLPGIFALSLFTPLGPVAMYGVVKVTDFVKVAIASWQLKKERWIKNLTGGPVETESVETESVKTESVETYSVETEPADQGNRE